MYLFTGFMWNITPCNIRSSVCSLLYLSCSTLWQVNSKITCVIIIKKNPNLLRYYILKKFTIWMFLECYRFKIKSMLFRQNLFYKSLVDINAWLDWISLDFQKWLKLFKYSWAQVIFNREPMKFLYLFNLIRSFLIKKLYIGICNCSFTIYMDLEPRVQLKSLSSF